jgi:hypothetical protein
MYATIVYVSFSTSEPQRIIPASLCGGFAIQSPSGHVTRVVSSTRYLIFTVNARYAYTLSMSSSSSSRLGSHRLPAAGAETEKARVRRFHHRSRDGCQHCKTRRVRCDEVKPVCGNCLKRDEVAMVSGLFELHLMSVRVWATVEYRCCARG